MTQNFKKVISILKKQKGLHVSENKIGAKAIYKKGKGYHVLHIDKNGYINDTHPKQFLNEVKQYGW